MSFQDKEAERAYQRQYQLDRYRRWMSEARATLGGKCVVCGATEDLQFDHIDPATKAFTLGSKRVNRADWDAEVAKCQLLCVPHHIEKTAREQRREVHGTWGMVRRKCHCEVCRGFVAAYMREYKRRKRAAKAQ